MAYIVERLAEAKKVCADPVVILESRLDFSKYVPGGFGTGDCLIIAEPVLDVIDYKYGKVIRVQWLVILVLLLALAFSLAFRPFAQRKVVSPAPTPAPQQAAATPQVETASPEPTPALVSLGEFKLTAYCACEKCCSKDPSDPSYGITAYGYQTTAGRTIAVDPKVIPIGSEVVINGHTYIAEDVGGAIKENRIDIYFDTHQEALEFGVQYAEVFINQ